MPLLQNIVNDKCASPLQNADWSVKFYILQNTSFKVGIFGRSDLLSLNRALSPVVSLPWPIRAPNHTKIVQNVGLQGTVLNEILKEYYI